MVAVCEVKRKGENDPIKATFSVADAKKASLWGKAGPWQQYPKRMLAMRARAFDRPILFSGPMVRALLAGTKTQTRRIIKPRGKRPSLFDGGWSDSYVLDPGNESWRQQDIAFRIGDRLWVRETWSGLHEFRDTPPAMRESYATPDGPALRDDVIYWADGDPIGGSYEKPRPGIHMPRWASRLTLTVTDVRVERLQDISEEDAIADGITRIGAEYLARGSTTFNGPNFYQVDMGFGTLNDVTAVDVYRRLWEWINGEGSWDANPWLVAYTFTVHHCNIDQMAKEAA